jgi:2-polyprenyl-6-methoxyphenol hydroxylase-like FAD-dependent oxidoreductase
MQGFNPLRVSRRKLRALLGEGIDVRYGKKITAISTSGSQSGGGGGSGGSDGDGGVATATFADGSTATGHLIVGCDGVHSYVREALVGRAQAANRPIDIHMINTCWTLPREVALLQREAHPIFRIGYHPRNVQWVTRSRT